VSALLMKGASLAFDVYPDPAWRVRSDVDLLIRATDRAAARGCLADLGYTSEPEVSGRLVAFQFHSQRVDAGRVRHLFDVHGKIATPRGSADAVGFRDLAAAAGPRRSSVRMRAASAGRTRSGWPACIVRRITTISRRSSGSTTSIC